MSIPLDSSQPKRGCKGLSLHTPTRLMGIYYERLIASLPPSECRVGGGYVSDMRVGQFGVPSGV